MKRLAIGLLGLLAFVGPVHADDHVSNFMLDNGMEVVVIEDHRAPVVVHMVWYRAGSADEPAGKSGIAHFLEHLMFKGTQTLSPGEFSATVAKNGGTDNAFTSFDYTAYFQRVAADRLELMMQMESDRMVNLRLTEEEVLPERDVILEERNQRTDNDPGALFAEQERAALYLNHQYGVPIIGWRHEMETLSMEDALAFYEDFYAPNNAVLIVAGDVDPTVVQTLAETYYGVIPANPAIAPKRLRTQEPPHNTERRLIFKDPRVAQPYVRRSYLAPERNTGNQDTAAALMLLSELLGGGQTSFLAQKLQFEEKTSLYAGAGYGGSALDPTSFLLVNVPAPGVSLQEAEDAMDAALDAFFEAGVDSDHLARIKTQMRASQIYAQDDLSGLANRYGRALTQGLTVADVQAWPQSIQDVTEDDIIAAAKDLFDDRKSVTGWLMTEEKSE